MKLYGAIDLHSNNNVLVIHDEQDKVEAPYGAALEPLEFGQSQ